jgi:Ca2+-binding RTX toxin-like protein
VVTPPVVAPTPVVVAGLKLVAAFYNDTLVGGAGNDTLEAGQGQGVLTGNAGADTFVFKAMPWNAGRITDFQVGVDKLDISALYAGGYAGANPVADGYVTFVNNGAGGTDVYLDPDGRAGLNLINFKIVTLAGVSPAGLTASSVLGSATAGGTTGGSTGGTAGGSTVGVKLVAATYNATLVGGAGNDTLEGGQGQGVLTGGAGSDTFAFKAMPWNAGRITDFQVGVDRLDISALYTNGYTGSNPVADGYVTFVNNGAGGTDVYLDTDGVGGANAINFKVVTLAGVSSAGLTSNGVFGERSAAGSASIASTGPAGVKLTAQTYNATLVGGAGADTLEAGQGQGLLTGGAGSDLFVFNDMPWNAGRISDFQVGVDFIDISDLYTNGYSGANPVADGYVTFVANGAGGTDVLLDTDGPGGTNSIRFKVVSLDGVQPGSLIGKSLFADSDLI